VKVKLEKSVIMITLTAIILFVSAIVNKNKKINDLALNYFKNSLKLTSSFSWIILYFLIFYALFCNITESKAQNCTNLTLSFSYTLNNNGCINPDTIKLNNTSSGSNASTSTYYWKINGYCFDTTSGLVAPNYIIKSQGSYTITLIAVTSSSCVDSCSKNIVIYTEAVPDFSMLTDTVCKNSRAFFTNNSTGTNTNTNYYWSFGNSQSSTNKDTVSVKYTSSGSYTVSLKVTQNNCVYNKSKAIIVSNGKSPIKFYNNLGIALETVSWKRCLSLVTDPDTFTQSFASPDTLVNYTINFGDGSSSSGSVLLPYPNGIIKHKYMTTGVFDVYIISRDVASCERIFYGKVINLRYPVVGVGGPDNGHTNGCIPFTTSFKNTSSHVSGCTEFTWEFGDGNTEKYDYSNQGDSVYHTYKTSKCNMNIVLKATNSCGTTQTTWGPVNAYNIDTAKITADKTVVCWPNTTVNFQNLTKYNCYSETRNFFWDFGDGSNSGWTTIGAGTSHKYNSTGNFFVKFKDSNLCGVDTYSVKITVYGPLQAGFKYSPSNIGCKKYTVTFTDTSSGDNISSYSWNFGDNTTSSLKNPVHTYNDTGTFTVTLTITASCGTSSFSKVIKVYKNPVAQIGQLNDQCIPAMVKYVNNSKDYSPYVKFNWSLGDSTSSTAFQPADKSFYTPGTYTIKLLVSDTCGIDSVSQTFKVYSNPEVSFITTTSVICQYQKAIFYNTTSFADSLIWDFGDNSSKEYTQNIPGLSRNYNSYGTFYAKLKALNKIGCYDVDSVKITVNPAPEANFTSNVYSGCVPMYVTYTNTSANADTFYWYIDGIYKSNASSLSSKTFTVPNDSETVMLVVKNKYNCRADTAIHDYFTYDNPTASFSKNISKGCGPLSVSFTNHSKNANNYIWNFGDGDTSTSTNPVHAFKSSSIKDTFYIVSLKAYSAISCIDISYDTVWVYPLPKVDFNISTIAGCGPLNATYTNTSSPRDTGSISIMSFSWDLGNGKKSTKTDESSVYTASKYQDSIYYVKLIGYSEHACVDSVVKQVKVYPNPTASFTVNKNNGCSPFSPTFTNNSKSNSSNGSLSYLWDFNNGQTSTSSQPNISFYNNKFGDSIYKVKLMVISANNCKDSFQLNISVHSDPVSSFSVTKTSGCAPLSVAFTNKSQTNDTSNVATLTYLWIFGGNVTSTAANPTTVFNSANFTTTTYQVKLITISIHGCTDTSTQSITVNPLPSVSFSPSATTSCGPATISFTNYSKPNDTGSVVSDLTYFWNFGNGTSSTLKDPTSTFYANTSSDTVYPVELIASSKYGCVDSITKSIVVYANPSVHFTMDKKEGCSPYKVIFKNISFSIGSASYSKMSFSWDFGNGIKSSKTDTSVLYSLISNYDTTYQIILKGYSEFGCSNTDTQSFIVRANPSAAFNINKTSGCDPLVVNFTNSSLPSLSGSASKLTYKWNFGNGDTSIQANPQSKFVNSSSQTKTYNILLEVFNEYGCKSVANSSVNVNPKPEVSFYLADTSSCQMLTANFVNTSHPNDPDNKINYFWSFGNGVYSSAKDTTITFQSAAKGMEIFKIVLRGENSFSCSDSFEKQVVVYAVPNADFSFLNNNDCGVKVIFSNLSASNDNKPISSMNFIWNYGNQKISQNISDTVTFMQSITNDTTYKVTLVAENTYACKDTVSKIVYVHPKPVITYSVSKNETCSGAEIYFINNSKNLDQYTWYFGDGKTSNYQNPVYSYYNYSPTASNYASYLIGNSKYGCFGDTFKQSILVHPVQSADIITSSDSGCAPMTTSFYNNSHNSSSFQWFVSGKQASTSTNFSTTFSGSIYNDTIYKVTLISRNDIGCSDTATKEIKVFQQVIADFDYSQTQGCSPSGINYLNQSTGANAYFWNLGNGQTSTETNTSSTYSNFFFQDVSYDVTLFAISKHNCFDTVRKAITVHPIPLASFSADKLQGCDPVIVNFTNQSIIADSFLWNFGDGVTSSLQQPAHVFTTNAQEKIFLVKLTVFTKYGCSHSFSKEIRVFSTPKAAFNTSDSGCIPVVTNFKDNSENATYWHWEFGDGHTSSEKNPTHIYNQSGEFSVKLRVSNYLGCSDTFTMYHNIKAWQVPKAEFIADKYYSEYPDVDFTFTSLSPTGLVHHWSFGNDRVIKTTNTVKYSFKDTGTYFITLAVSTPHCSDTTKKVVIIQPPLPKSDFDFNIVNGCLPLNVQFTDKSLMATEWLWYFGDGEYSTEKNPQHTYIQPGKFSVTLITTNSRGSHSIYKKEVIEVFALPSVYFEVTPTPAYLPKAKVDLVNLTVNASSYQWYIDGELFDTLENTSKLFYEAGSHDVKLIAKSIHACVDSMTKEQAIKIDTLGQIFMPNAFTPNDDGKNDIFTPIGFGYDQNKFSMSIFNRWGELIYETNDIEQGWNGTCKGNMCMEGIYIYRITITMSNNETRNLNGSVHLLR